MKNDVYDCHRGIQILERILRSRKSSREKKLLVLIGLVNMAEKGRKRIYHKL